MKVSIKPGKEHRFVILFRGEGLSDGLTDADPQKDGKPSIPTTAITDSAKFSEKVINRFIEKATQLLKSQDSANTLLLRGFAQIPKIPTMTELFKIRPAAIAVYPMYRGIASLVGMEVLDTGEEITIETWIQLRSLKASWSTVYSKNAQSNAAGFHWVYITQDGSVAYQYCNGSAYVALTAPVNWVFDEWTRLAITHKINGDKGGVVKWYINGEMIQEKQHVDKALEVVGGKASIGTYQSNPDPTRRLSRTRSPAG